MHLVPSELTPLLTLLLLGLSFCTSLITACLGAGGGLLMLMALSLVLPPAAIIPIHGSVQLGSNCGRAFLARADTCWLLVRRFSLSTLIGAGAAGLVLVQLPAAVWQLAIAGFVLYLCWGPQLPRVALGRAGVWVTAALTGFLTMFVGATGPLVAAYLRQILQDRRQIVATMATVLCLQHGIKAVLFSVGGFNFLPWLIFIAAMILCGTIGTWLGLRWLGRMDNRRFLKLFNLVLSLLALRLLWLGLRGLGWFS